MEKVTEKKLLGLNNLQKNYTQQYSYENGTRMEFGENVISCEDIQVSKG